MSLSTFWVGYVYRLILLGTENIVMWAWSYPSSASLDSRNCCKNGGTCILGSFCFIGRSCEYDERVRIIPHGEGVQNGCSYCRCGFGVLHCFPQVFHEDCDEDQEVRWFRSMGVADQVTTVSSTTVS
eukprot:XP_013983338.1 PREDICTED: teratocarcinoma-derived growth factor-like [Salmo salar]